MERVTETQLLKELTAVVRHVLTNKLSEYSHVQRISDSISIVHKCVTHTTELVSKGIDGKYHCYTISVDHPNYWLRKHDNKDGSCAYELWHHEIQLKALHATNTIIQDLIKPLPSSYIIFNLNIHSFSSLETSSLSCTIDFWIADTSV